MGTSSVGAAVGTFCERLRRGLHTTEGKGLCTIVLLNLGIITYLFVTVWVLGLSPVEGRIPYPVNAAICGVAVAIALVAIAQHGRLATSDDAQRMLLTAEDLE